MTPRPGAIALWAVVTAGWGALWGELTPANLLSGAVIGAVAVAARPAGRGAASVRPVALARLVALVAADAVRSTVTVAIEVLTRVDRTHEAVIAVALPPAARRHLFVVAVAVTATPGAAVVDVDESSSTLHLHLLHADRRHDVEAHVARVAALASAALPVDDPAPTVEVT